MTHPRARKGEVERVARRRKVAAILLSGVSDQMVIAEQLGVSQATISRDIEHVEHQWTVEAAQDISMAKGKDLRRLDRLISALWGDAIQGKWLATDRVLALMQHRARLLGLEAPKQVEDNRTVTIAIMAEQIASETGLNKDEILAEAQAIITKSIAEASS